MSKSEWKRAWRFAREHWPQINHGDMWHLLSADQLLAASFRWLRG